MTCALTDELRRTLTGMRKMLGLSQRDVGRLMDPPVGPDAIGAFEQSAGDLMVSTAKRVAAAEGFELTFVLRYVGMDADGQ